MYAVSSTSFGALQQLYQQPKSKLSNDYFCPQSKCINPTDPDLIQVCKEEHVEHFGYSNRLIIDNDGQNSNANYDLLGSNEWMDNGIKDFGWRLTSGSCDLGQCIFWSQGLGSLQVCG